MKRGTAILVLILMATLIILVNGLGVYYGFQWNTDTPLQVSVVATALIAFVSLLMLGQNDDGRLQLTESSMRTAIAGSIVIVYLVLVGIVAFFKAGPQRLPPISETLIANFTTIVGVVIAFYFGASAYIQARTKGTSSEEVKEVKYRGDA